MGVNTGVKYIGKEAVYQDNILRTGLVWEKGETHSLPVTMAKEFLKHPSVFSEVPGFEYVSATSSGSGLGGGITLTGVTTETGLASVKVTPTPGSRIEIPILYVAPTGSGGNKSLKVRVGGIDATSGTLVATAASTSNQSVDAKLIISVADDPAQWTIHAIATGMTSSTMPTEMTVSPVNGEVAIWINGQLGNSADAMTLKNVQVLKIG